MMHTRFFSNHKELNFTFFLLIFCLHILFLSSDSQSSAKSDNYNSITHLKINFSNPDYIYAPFFFWFWDTPIDDAQTQNYIVNMATKMKSEHINPGYVHARMNMVGLADLPQEQWLSKDWFKTFNNVLYDVEQNNMYFGYVDDYWWPSGRAAGRVLANNPDLWAISLSCQTIDVLGGTNVDIPDCFFAVTAKVVQSSSIDIEYNQDFNNSKFDIGAMDILTQLKQNRKRLEKKAEQDSLEVIPHNPATIESKSLKLIGSESFFHWQPPDSGVWRIYLFNKYYHPGCDGGRLNYLDKRLGVEFIKQAHEPYARHFSDKMGKSLSGVFVDHEGDYGYKCAWSEDLEKVYFSKTGENIRLWMPLLFDRDIEGFYAAARWNWFDVVSDLYVTFFQTVNKWCSEHGMYTISNLWEESLMWQASAVGDFFKAQRAFSLPGTDALGLRVLEPHDFMETKSVCAFEQRRFQSEIMGAAGFWGFNNKTIKQAANAAITWGVNHIVPHAVFVTRKLESNPWLPDWFDKNPMWPFLHLWADFVRRASYINTQGHVVADVLLLNPMDSVWALCGPGVFDPAFKGRVPGPAISPCPATQDIPRSQEQLKKESAWWTPPVMEKWYAEQVVHINNVYSETINQLINSRIEFLIADRFYLRQMMVKNNQLVRPPFLFTCLILPAMQIIPLDIAQMLLSFAQNGGKIIILDSFPTGSTENGMPDSQIIRIMEKLKAFPNVIFEKNSLEQLENIDTFYSSHITFTSGDFAMLQQHRKIDGHDFFWLANNTGKYQECRILLKGLNGGVKKWNCETGKIIPLTCQEDSTGMTVTLTFDPYEAFWLENSAEKSDHISHPGQNEKRIILTNPWSVKINKKQQPPCEFPFEFPALFQKSNINLSDWQQWGLDRFSGIVDYVTFFKLGDSFDKIFLDLGDVQVAAKLWINNKCAGERLWPPYRFDISDYARKGKNKIKISVANLLNNNFGDVRPSGLLGPVEVICITKNLKSKDMGE